ncbi:hypothetical protein IQ07DRAFT_647524 [Pyrenochaeta sp. DS3sAY3a]|nr:hypothetical protein IQ07DRAFT_647524 [Pyrenochaeta sp. DS3sAY3a]
MPGFPSRSHNTSALESRVAGARRLLDDITRLLAQLEGQARLAAELLARAEGALDAAGEPQPQPQVQAIEPMLTVEAALAIYKEMRANRFPLDTPNAKSFYDFVLYEGVFGLSTANRFRGRRARLTAMPFLRLAHFIDGDSLHRAAHIFVGSLLHRAAHIRGLLIQAMAVYQRWRLMSSGGWSGGVSPGLKKFLDTVLFTSAAQARLMEEL